jgi:hypothetical protein
MIEDKRIKNVLWTLAFLGVIYALSMGPAFRHARRASFRYYEPVRWLVHQAPDLPGPGPQVRDAYCAYLNWWADL